MTMRKLLTMTLLLLLPVATVAEQGRTYIIKKGDTLHGISRRFLKDPAYWPNLWANNPDIRNPHFIYPGQQVRIYDGRIEVVAAEPPPAEAPVPVAPPAPTPGIGAVTPQPVAPTPQAPAPPPAEPEITVKIRAGLGYLSAEQVAGVGVVVDAMDNRLLIANGDSVFVKFAGDNAPQPGTRYSLIEVGDELNHPQTGKPVGYRIVELGSLRVTSVTPDIATGTIEAGTREVLRGTRLVPYIAPVQTIVLKRARVALHGHVVGTFADKLGQAKDDLVFLDLGREQGLEVGNLISVTRKRVASELAKLPIDMELPEQLIGSAVITDIGERSATALVLKSIDAIYVGDRVTVETGH